MGLGDEYSRDAFTYETIWDSDDQDEFDNELEPEDWQAMYSDEILDGWMYIREFADENYLMIRADYPRFVALVMEPSRWFSQSVPTDWQRTLWDKISKIQPISERVEPENFYGWVENFMRYL